MTLTQHTLSWLPEFAILIGVVFCVAELSPEISPVHSLSAIYILIVYTLSVYVHHRALPKAANRQCIRRRLIWLTGPALCLVVLFVIAIIFAIDAILAGATKELFAVAHRKGIPRDHLPSWSKAYEERMESDVVMALLLAATWGLRYAENLRRLTRHKSGLEDESGRVAKRAPADRKG